MDNEIEEIFNDCVRIRNSILKVQKSTSIFQNFPIGCCRDSSLLIGFFLTEKGFENINYCHTAFNDDTDANVNATKSHAWLKYKNYIIDITASQFGNKYEDVIVKSNMTHNEIYRNAKTEAYNLGIAGMDSFRILDDYKRIKENL